MAVKRCLFLIPTIVVYRQKWALQGWERMVVA